MIPIPTTLRRDPSSWLARVVSVVVSSWITLPIWSGGWLVHGDHAPHIQEALDLAAHTSGWSDVAFAGFPLGSLHSPLFYGLLALVVRLGAPAWIAYTSFVTASEIVLGLVALEVARRRVAPPFALGVAVLVQTQSLLVSGPSGVLSGMWTFGLAVAFFLLLADRLHEPLDARIGAQIAALVALIGLTHTFAIHAVVALVLVRTASLVALGREERRAALGVAIACALGAIASAAYWLQAMLTIGTSDIEPVVQSGWPNFQIFFRPFLEASIDPISVVRAGRAELPDLILLVLAALSFLRLSRLEPRARALLATSVGTMLLVLLVVSRVATMEHREVFGPIPWRIMVVVRALLLFPAVDLFAQLRLEPKRALAATLAVGALCLGWAYQRSHLLQLTIPPRAHVGYAEIDAVYREVAALAPSLEGRVYVQNTQGTAPPPLNNGHPLALLPSRAGVRAVGSYYSLVPFPTDRWLTNFAGPLVGERVSDATRAIIDRRLNDLGAELVVLTEPRAAEVMRRWTPSYRELARIGSFTILRRPNPGMIRTASPGARLSNFVYDDGRIEFDVARAREPVTVELAVSYASGWRLEPPLADASPRPRDNGLMSLPLPPGDRHVALVYRAPRWPLALSVAGWLAILGGALAARRRRSAARGAAGADTSPSVGHALARHEGRH